jgi:hypothetical protein
VSEGQSGAQRRPEELPTAHQTNQNNKTARRRAHQKPKKMATIWPPFLENTTQLNC